MKRLKKIILWVILIGVVVVILGAAGVALFFPKEKVKAMAIEKMSSALDREVTIDGISVSFWGGIGAYLENIKIANPENFEEKYFLDAKALDVKLQFWPLLKKQVMVDRLILVEPQINLRKLESGATNYQFGVVDSLAPEAVKEKLPEESKLAVSAVSFENLAIKDGRLSYVDDSSKMKIIASGLKLESKVKTPQPSVFQSSGEIEIGSLAVEMDTVAYPEMAVKCDYDATFNGNEDRVSLNDAKVRINDVALTLGAEVPNFSELNKAELKVNSEKTKISSLLKLLPDEYKALLEGYNIDGDLVLDADVIYDEKTADTLSYSGNMILSDMAITMTKYPGNLAVKSGKAGFKKDYAEIELSEASFENNPFKLSCKVNDFEKPVVSGDVSGRVDLVTVNGYLPKTGNPKLAGDMSFDLKFSGPVDQLSQVKLAGDLNLDKASYTAETLPEPIETMNLKAKINDRNVIIDNMYVQFPSSDVSMKGELADAFPYFIPGSGEDAKKPFLTFEMSSKRFNTDKLFPEAVPGEGQNLAELPLDSLPPIILPDIDGKGTAKFDTLIYTNVEFTNITSDVVIKDRVINANNANGNVYTGKVKGQAAVDLNDFNNPVYTGTYEASQIEVNDFLTRFTKFGGHLFGKVNMNGDFKATGWEPEDLIKTLTLDGSALFNEAKLVNFDVIQKMAQSFNFSSVKEETIRDLASSFKVRDGRVIFDALKFFNNMGDWNIIGSVGFDGSLDYSGEVLLTENMTSELMAKSDMVAGMASLLKDKKSGRVKVGFKLGGTYSNPKPTLDLSPAKEQLEDKLKNKVGDALKGLLGK
ncbi:MAG: AsmA family protein [Candidatus Zixiibacteriota bacterium]